MIICICRRLNEAAVREAVSAGAREPEAVQAHHGCAFNCGKCRTRMGEIISDAVDKSQAPCALVAAE
ncbi:MAG: (2Fe-2S)-binding protein [Pseudomonadota bacterium]